jgi:hypothetical protein
MIPSGLIGWMRGMVVCNNCPPPFTKHSIVLLPIHIYVYTNSKVKCIVKTWVSYLVWTTRSTCNDLMPYQRRWRLAGPLKNHNPLSTILLLSVLPLWPSSKVWACVQPRSLGSQIQVVTCSHLLVLFSFVIHILEKDLGVVFEMGQSLATNQNWAHMVLVTRFGD